MMKKFFLLPLLLFVAFNSLNATPIDSTQNHVELHNLAPEWQVYSDEYKSFIPYFTPYHKQVKAASMWLEIADYKEYNLIFYTPTSPIYLFINQKLAKEVTQKGWNMISLDSLSKIYPTKKVFLTFYDASSTLPLPKIYIGYKKPQTITKLTPKKTQLSILKRPTQNLLANFVIILLIIATILYSFLWNNYTRLFKDYYTFRDLLYPYATEENLLMQKPFSTIGLLFLLFYSLILSGTYFLWTQINPNIYIPNALMEPEGILNIGFIFLNYLRFFLYTCLVIFLKYLFLLMMGYLLGTGNLVNPHFFQYIKISKVFYEIIFLVSIFLLITQAYLLKNFAQILPYILIGFFIIRICIIGIYLKRKFAFRNLYFFTYICSTEIFSLLFSIKLMFFH